MQFVHVASIRSLPLVYTTGKGYREGEVSMSDRQTIDADSVSVGDVS